MSQGHLEPASPVRLATAGNVQHLLRGYGSADDSCSSTCSSTTTSNTTTTTSKLWRPSLSGPHLLAALGLTEPLLDARGQLDVGAMVATVAGYSEEEVRQRRLVAALGSLQPFLRGLQLSDVEGGGSGSSQGPAAAGAGGAVPAGTAALPPPLPPLSAAEVSHERQAAVALQAQCRQMLRSLPTSIDEDQALLQADQVARAAIDTRSSSAGAVLLAPRMRLAVAARLECKLLLAAVESVLQQYCNALG